MYSQAFIAPSDLGFTVINGKTCKKICVITTASLKSLEIHNLIHIVHYKSNGFMNGFM